MANTAGNRPPGGCEVCGTCRLRSPPLISRLARQPTTVRQPSSCHEQSEETHAGGLRHGRRGASGERGHQSVSVVYTSRTACNASRAIHPPHGAVRPIRIKEDIPARSGSAGSNYVHEQVPVRRIIGEWSRQKNLQRIPEGPRLKEIAAEYLRVVPPDIAGEVAGQRVPVGCCRG